MKVTIKELIIESDDNIGGIYISFDNSTKSSIEKTSTVPSKVTTYIPDSPPSPAPRIIREDGPERPTIPLPPEMENVEF